MSIDDEGEYWENEGWEPPELPFWQSVDIEVDDADYEGFLATPLSKEQILEAIRSAHADREKYPLVEDISLEGTINQLGLFRFQLSSSRGTELVKVWIVPKL